MIDQPRVHRSYRTVGGAQLHLRAAGGTGPRVALLHHAPASAAVWDPLLPPLAERGLAAVAVDLPGYGGSDRPAAAPDLSWYADRIADFLDLEAPGEPWLVVGRQTGAAVAAAVAVRRPRLVRGLMLWGYPVFEPALMTRLATETTDPLTEELSSIRHWLADLHRVDRLAGSDDYVRAALADHLAAGSEQHWAHNALGRADPEALLRLVEQPIVLVYDLTRTDLPAQLAAVSRARTIVPRATFVDIAGVSSSLAPDAVPVLAELVARFATSPASVHPTGTTDGENHRP
ncbi:MAG TPA: alpha/beta hydrolase [Pseudonocardiaceae bacterium]|nr:alpha/beta hydrolase [Pseudonocardiaceae bacterium]